MTDVEVLVVGGGPVGLATAIEARLAGRDVLLVEPRQGPIDKACGEGLLPGALAAVHRLGIDPAGHRLAGIRYADARRSVVHPFAGPGGRGVRRTTLHADLLARADELGVPRLVGSVRDVSQREGRVSAAGVEARWLIACDGLHSTVRRAVGLERAVRPGRTAPPAGRRFGLRRHHAVEPWSDQVEVHWTATAEVYVTPVAPDLVGIAVLGLPPLDIDAVLADLPDLRRHLDGPVVGRVRGAGPLRQLTRARTAGGVRLAGDASGYVDALTGEGLRVGLAQAAAAVATLGDDAAYERAWRAATREHRVLTGALVAWATSPARPAVVPLAVAAPWLFGLVVERLAR